MKSLVIRRTTTLLFLALVVLAGRILGSDAVSCLWVLEGRHVQVTEYAYRLVLSPDTSSTEAMIGLLCDVSQPWYRVSIESQSVTASVEPLSRVELEDTLGNRDVMLFWSGSYDEIVVERRVRATTEAIYSFVSLPDPFPVARLALPAPGTQALQATEQIQSGDNAIVALAHRITEPCATQLDAVVRILSWIRREVEYACSRDLCDPVYRTDALFTLEKRKGNCVSYANLAVALLRAARIPVIEASGFVADRPSSAACHAWIAVYFPTSGWIEFESSDWMPSGGDAPITFLMPQHLTVRRGPSTHGVSHAPFDEIHETSVEVLERPEAKTRVSAPWSSEPVAWVMTVRSPTYEDARLELQVLNPPAGWEILLSESDVGIGENDVSRTVDVLVTAIPPPHRDERSVSFAVVCVHDTHEMGRVDFEVRTAP